MLPAALRSWPALAALGAGLVLAALAAGATGPVAVGVLFAAGLAALAWAFAALRAGGPVLPRTTLAVGLTVVVGLALVVGAGAAPQLGLAGLPTIAAAGFALVVAVGAAARLRGAHAPGEGPDETRDAAPASASPAAPAATRTRHPVAATLGLVAGAALVAALATPALAGTEPGELAVPHGELHQH
ncbi:hypothetical protein [Agromyces mediolanus]|uniref:hypothetical protein n=1 Tax=Agromyces mediolanus TaxID=41986 RepID=UPI001E4D67D8|nr:hypothetical protein [Agromyces mediolanus]MCD1570328.1 hypothetical protein [Agromyces mediolanus]